MNDKLTVFISSIMNTTLDNLMQERDLARKAIESLTLGITWRFEDSPAASCTPGMEYLSAVKEADIFLLILRADITPTVIDEYYIAWGNSKPILVFLVNKSDRAPSDELICFLRHLRQHHKYKECQSDTLQDEVRRAVAHEIVRNAKASQVTRNRMIQENVHSDITGLLRGLVLDSTTFEALDRDAPRTTLEMTKERPTTDALVPLMAKIPDIGCVHDQIQFLKDNHFAYHYADSWVDQEVQLIGAWVLKKLLPLMRQCKRVYDAGCGNCGQYKALAAIIGEHMECAIEYIGQDYNPEWESFFAAERGTFIRDTLPRTSAESVDLLACAHVLQDLVENPIAIYATLFAFNLQIIDDGWCYITVPDKDSQPGLLDVLEVSARDAGFTIRAAGRCRLTRQETLSGSQPLGLTTFDYLLLQKSRSVDRNAAHTLSGFSFFRWNDAAMARDYGISKEGDIPEDHIWIERELRELLGERDERMRTLRYVLNSAQIAAERHVSRENSPIAHTDPGTTIRNVMREVHDVMSGTFQREAMQNVCRSYLMALLSWFFVRYAPLSRQVVLMKVIPILDDALKRPRDVRVHIDDLTDGQVARLVRHLFEIQQYWRLDLRKER